MNNKWKTVLIWLVGIGIVALIVFVGMKDTIVRSLNEEANAGANAGADGEVDAEADAVKIEPVDVEAYYKENSEIVASYDAKTSESIQSEKQATEDLSSRGFTQYPVSYDYSMEGEYIRNQEATDSGDQHPIYQTYYVSANDELWTIIVVNGCIVANPVSYNMQSERGVQFVISESNVITGFDSANNVFYETIPNESELLVYVVDKIDAGTLDALTVEEISGL